MKTKQPVNPIRQYSRYSPMNAMRQDSRYSPMHYQEMFSRLREQAVPAEIFTKKENPEQNRMAAMFSKASREIVDRIRNAPGAAISGIMRGGREAREDIAKGNLRVSNPIVGAVEGLKMNRTLSEEGANLTPNNPLFGALLGTIGDSALPGVGGKAKAGKKVFEGFKDIFKQARKYKSADEFVKAQGTPVYHGTRQPLREEKGLFSLTKNRSIAENYSQAIGGGRAKMPEIEGAYLYDDFWKFNKGKDVFEFRGQIKTRKEMSELGKRWEVSPVYKGARVDEYVLPKNINILDVTTEQGRKVIENLSDNGNRTVKAIISNTKENKIFDWSATKLHIDEFNKILLPQLEAKGFGGINYYDDIGKTIGVFDVKNLKTKSQLTQAFNEAKGQALLLQEARKFKSADEFVKAQTTKFEDLSTPAKSAIQAEARVKMTNFGKSAEEVNPFETKWIKKTETLESLKASNPDVFADTFTHKGSVTKGGIIVDKDGIVIDGNNRLREAFDRGEKTIETFEELSIKTKSQLTDIFNKANKVDALAQEARKFKTADEFVRAQGTPVYHGTNNPEAIRKGGFSISKEAQEGSSFLGDNFVEGVHLSKSKKPYMEGGQLEDVAEVLDVILPQGKILKTDLKGIGNLYQKYGINEMGEGASPKLTNALKKAGYDGIEYADEIVIFDPSQIKTKSQLTDIFNEANKLMRN